MNTKYLSFTKHGTSCDVLTHSFWLKSTTVKTRVTAMVVFLSDYMYNIFVVNYNERLKNRYSNDYQRLI